jgi:hypothetical protein
MRRRICLGGATVTLVALAISCGKSSESPNEQTSDPDPVFGGSVGENGGSSSGGNAATGGTPGVLPCETLSPSGDFPLIDNFDDGDLRVSPGDSNREGFWFYLGDDKGTYSHDATQFVPSPGGVGNSVFAAHFGGDGFSDWGFGIGTGLARRTVSHTCPVDATLFAGVRFRARGQLGPENEGHARITLSVPDTLDQQWGGRCTANCGDVHQRYFPLCPEWRQYVFSFEDFQQGGWGNPVVLDPTELVQLHFEVSPNGTPGGLANQPADVWIDDIRFVTADEVEPIEFTCDAPPYLGLGGANGTGGTGNGTGGTNLGGATN